jgi:hypothetical protein
LEPERLNASQPARSDGEQGSTSCHLASFNRPGRNLTGVNLDTTHLISKRLEMLQEFVPNSAKVGVLASPGRSSPEGEAKFYKEKRMVVVKVNPNVGLQRNR